MVKETLRSHCPVNYTLELLGDSWSFLIIRDMMLREKHYFFEFLESEERIASNILSSRLKKLTTQNIINCKIDSIKKSRKYYYLTKKGKDLLPIILDMVLWGAEYDKHTDTPAWMIKRIKNERIEYEEELLLNLEE